MIMFDASNRDECQVIRYRTNTPLQALIMLNDPTMLEASKALADQGLQHFSDKHQVIENAFVAIICRKPTDKEIKALTQFYESGQGTLKADPKKVEKLISVGAYKAQTKNKTDLAAMMQTIQIIYNMQEAITKT